jgi:hypothetical protein
VINRAAATTAYDLMAEGGNGPLYRYSLLECSRCNDASLVLELEVAEDVWIEDGVVYPAQRSGLSKAVPSSIRSSFDEALACLRARAHTAAAIMCRRSLEALAHEHGARGRTLQDKIAALESNGVIDKRLLDWATEVRIAGNAAAHDVGTETDAQDARDMCDLAEAILDFVYVFKLVTRRSRRVAVIKR